MRSLKDVYGEAFVYLMTHEVHLEPDYTSDLWQSGRSRCGKWNVAQVTNRREVTCKTCRKLARKT